MNKGNQIMFLWGNISVIGIYYKKFFTGFLKNSWKSWRILSNSLSIRFIFTDWI